MDKQKVDEAKMNAEKDQKAAEKNSDQIRRDSATLATPAPAATFQIKK